MFYCNPTTRPITAVRGWVALYHFFFEPYFLFLYSFKAQSTLSLTASVAALTASRLSEERKTCRGNVSTSWISEHFVDRTMSFSAFPFLSINRPLQGLKPSGTSTTFIQTHVLRSYGDLWYRAWPSEAP